MTNLMLGTAQFGLAYGITNAVGTLSDESVAEILDVANAAGINLFDTAPGYGTAQQRLGALGNQALAPRYVSKFALPVDDDVISSDSLYGDSLSALRVESLYGLMFHRVEDLRDRRADAAWSILRRARETGVVLRIGASIYDESDLRVAAERFPDLDLIQIPGNLLDRRLLEHPEIRRLHDRGVEIHVRSAYLQGLLLAEPKSVPVTLQALVPVLERFWQEAISRNTSKMTLALEYLKNHPVVDAVLTGATTPDELQSTVDAWSSAHDESATIDLPSLPVEILDPRLWSIGTVER